GEVRQQDAVLAAVAGAEAHVVARLGRGTSPQLTPPLGERFNALPRRCAQWVAARGRPGDRRAHPGVRVPTLGPLAVARRVERAAQVLVQPDESAGPVVRTQLEPLERGRERW